MKTSMLKISSALSLIMTSTLLTACGAGEMSEYDVGDEEMAGEEGEYYSEEIELGSVEQGLHNCSNPDGTNNVMAAFAVAVAKELGRWRTELDFQVVGDRIALHPGGWEPQQGVYGRWRCGNYANNCRGIDALLSLQNDNATGVYVQGETSNTKVLVNPGALRSRMKAKLEEQKNKALNFKDGVTYEGAKTPHTLASAGSGSLGGCGPHFKYDVSFIAPVTPPKVPLASQLKYSLYFADQANGWVDFRSNVDGVANRVAIDPTYGLSEGSSTTAGSCEVACTKLSPNASPAGLCCACGGVQKTFRQSAFSTALFLCQ